MFWGSDASVFATWGWLEGLGLRLTDACNFVYNVHTHRNTQTYTQMHIIHYFHARDVATRHLASARLAPRLSEPACMCMRVRACAFVCERRRGGLVADMKTRHSSVRRGWRERVCIDKQAQQHTQICVFVNAWSRILHLAREPSRFLTSMTR
jgi:hypothetical protein